MVCSLHIRTHTHTIIHQAFENVRKALESCDVDADIDLFVREKTTGTERPTPIPYENYYHPTSTEMPTGPVGKAHVPPPSQRELPPTPDEAMTDDAPSNECECGMMRGWEGGGYNISLLTDVFSSLTSDLYAHP